jgi:hypothetical protein
MIPIPRKVFCDTSLIKDLPEEVTDNLIELIRIIKRTIIYKLDSEEKPIILGQFESLKDDWEAPGMEVYDDL